MSLYHEVIEALLPLIQAFDQLGISYSIGGSVFLDRLLQRFLNGPVFLFDTPHLVTQFGFSAFFHIIAAHKDTSLWTAMIR